MKSYLFCAFQRLVLCIIAFFAILFLITTSHAETIVVTENSSEAIVLPEEGNIYVVEDGSDSFEFSGIISGTGSLTKSGEGELYLSNLINTYTGATIVTEGTLRIANLNGINPDSTGNLVSGTSAVLSGVDTIDIGRTGIGTLDIQSGGMVVSVSSINIGHQVNSVGTVTVDGGSSELKSTGSVINIGNIGTGFLNLINGGKASAETNLYIGSAAGSFGTATIDGNGSELSGYDIWIGRNGTGTLSSANSGKVVAEHSIYIAALAGSYGTATVDGNDSILIASSDIIAIATSGTGILNLSNGGKATAADAIYIGQYSEGHGTVTVNGTGSELTAGTTLIVGNEGTGTLNLTNGGVVAANGSISLGYEAGSSGTVIVNSNSSRLNIGNEFYVGRSGTGSLSLVNGGKAIAVSRIYLGESYGSSGTISVDGTDSSLHAGTTLYVGVSGTGIISLLNGGAASATTSIILGNNASSSGTVMVGNGSSLTATSGDIYIGGYTIARGTGLLAGTGTVTANSGTGNIQVWSTGILSPGDYAGQIGTLTIDGNLTINGGSLIVDIGADNESDIVDVSGNVTITDSLNVNVTSLRKEGSYTLMNNVTTVTPTLNLLLNGLELTANTRVGDVLGNGEVTLKRNESENIVLEIVQGTSLDNATVTWTGLENSNWDLESENWTGAGTKFLDGDAVTFEDAIGTITILGTGKTVAQMSVTGADTNVVFEGNILADGTKTNLGANKSGKLILDATLSTAGTVTLNGKNEFHGGITMAAGTLVLGNDRALGTYETNMTTQANSRGQVTVTGNASVKVEENRTISNRFVVNSGSLTFDIGTNDLTIQNVDHSATSYPDYLAGAIDLFSAPADSLTISGTGKLSFLNNHSDGGGGAIGSNTTAIVLGDNVTFRSNSAGSAMTDGLGGAILTANANVTLGDNALFENNSALGTYGNGGAINMGGSLLTLGTDAVFRNNTAAQSGGALCLNNSTATTISHSGTLLFEGNRGYRSGAISAVGVVTLGGNVIFRDNISDYLGYGAIGISNGGILILHGNTLFENNTNKTNDGAGAISAKYFTFVADTGHIAFTGNAINTSTTPIASSLALQDRADGGLTISGNNNVYFDDPIHISTGPSSSATLTKSGTGFVQFIGTNVLNLANHDGGSVSIDAGTFRLANVNASTSSSFMTQGTGSVFDVTSAATLAGQGTITAEQRFTLSGTISPDGDRFEIPDGIGTLNPETARTVVADDKKIGTLTLVGAVELDGTTFLVDLGTGNASDKIVVTGAVSHGNESTINLANWETGTFTLLTASGGGLDLGGFNAVTLGGTAMTDKHYTAALSLGETDKQLILTASQNALDLVWNGTELASVWNTTNTNKNWLEGVNAEYFANGDNVTFTADATSKAVSVASDGVTVGNMTVSGGTYTFNGADATASITGTGKLSLTDGQATLNLDAGFQNADISGGTLVLGNEADFTTTQDLYVGNTVDGTLNITGGAVVTSGRFINIGYLAGSNGQITVSGTDSKLQASDFGILLGFRGTGQIDVTNGGTISTKGTSLGDVEGSSGTINVSGTGSSYTDTGTLRIGNAGDGTFNISGGATVVNTGTTYADGGASTSSLLTVDGTGSSFASNCLYVGTYGSGSVTIKNGATATIGTSGVHLSIMTSNAAAGMITVASGSALSTTSNVWIGSTNASTTGSGTLVGTGTITASGTYGILLQRTGTISAGDTAGAIGTINLVGNLALNGGTLLVDLGASNSSDLIAVTGNVTLSGTNTVDLNSWQIGTFDLVTASGTFADITDRFGAVTYNGSALVNRQAATLARSEDMKTLQLTTSSVNTNITWVGDGTANLWNNTGSNTVWKTATTTDDYFMTGDVVTFDATGSQNPAVTVAAGGVTVGGMTISGGSYTFTGADATSKIIGSTTASSGSVTPTGQLKIENAANVTLGVAADFEDGTSINNATLVLDHAQGLGTFVESDEHFKGYIRLAGNATIETTKDIEITNRFYSRGGATTFEIANDTTLTISGVKSTEVGEGGAVHTASYAGNISLTFSDGHLVMTKNEGTQGGAIHIQQVNSSRTATLDMSNLQSLTMNENKAEQGGGIFIKSSDEMDPTFGDNVTFSKNEATLNGGAIYVSYYEFSPGLDAVLTLGNDAVFSENQSGGQGGAIYITSFQNGKKTEVFFGEGAVLSGNTAIGDGGAIYATHTSGTPSGIAVSFDNDTTIEANRSQGSGGAVWSGQSVSVLGNTLFEDNLAASNGGAIYVDGSIAGAVTLNATDGDIAFTGNKSGVDFTDTENPVDGSANSIYLNKNTALVLSGSDNIYFDDAISSGATGGNSLSKTGTGMVQFVGSNILNPNNTAGGAVDITAGEFRVVDGASFTTGSSVAANKFTVGGNATLAGGGTITSQQGFTISGTVSPDKIRYEIPDVLDGTATLSQAAGSSDIGILTLTGNVELDGATLAIDLGASNASDKIAVTGNVTFGTNTNTIDLGTWQLGTFSILTTTGSIADINGKFTVDSGSLGNRQGASIALDETSKILELTTFTTNAAITWAGDGINNLWNTTAANTVWKSGAENDYFMAGDLVTFNDAGAANSPVAVAASGVTVGGMTVSGTEDYTFDGGKITGSTTNSTGVTATGKLNLSTTGTTTINTETDFVNGAAISAGKLVLGHDKALGVYDWEEVGDNGEKGKLTVTGTVTVGIEDDRTIKNRFVGSENASLTFDIAADKTFTVDGVADTAIAVDKGSLAFTGAGNFVLQDNTGENAIRVESDANISLDFSSLASVTVSDNGTSTTPPEYNRDATIFVSSDVDATVTFGDDVTFSGNHVGTGGYGLPLGVLYVSGDTVYVEFGNNAIFSDNFGVGGAVTLFGEVGNSLVFGDGTCITGNDGIWGSIVVAGINGAESEITFGKNATIDNNLSAISAINITGGKGTIAFDTGASFIGNQSFSSPDDGNGLFYGHGAAIQMFGDVTLSGNTLFKDNLAGSYGGAIYLGSNFNDSAEESSVLLNATGGDIAFTGNKQNVTFDGSNVPDTETGEANSIFMLNNTKLTISGAGNVFFDDPIRAGKVGEDEFIDETVIEYGGNSFVKNGTGFVQFMGANVLNPEYKNDSNEAALNGRVSINAGTFRLAGTGASFTTQGDVATFVVASAAKLAGQGTITAEKGFMISGTIAPDSDRFEIPTGIGTDTVGTSRTSIASGKQFGTLALVGNTNFNGTTLAIDIGNGSASDVITVTGALTLNNTSKTTVDIGNWSVGNYTFLSATSITDFTNTDFIDEYFNTVTINGMALGSRQSATLSKGTDAVILTTTATNTDITWTGAIDGNWNTSTVNWAAGEKYNPGDYVTFNDIVTTYAVVVGGTGVQVSGMKIDGGSYTFSGAKITGQIPTEGTNPQTMTGKLEFGTADGETTTLNLETDFERGYTIGGGTLVLGHDQALGVYATDTTTPANSTGQLTVTGNITVQTLADRTISNRFVVNAGTLTLNVADGTTLVISNVNNQATSSSDYYGGAIYLASDTNLVHTGGGAISFENNKSRYGGAISIQGNLTLGSNVSFIGNQAPNIGGGAIHSEGNVTLGDNALFLNNESTGNAGGAIAMKGTNLTLGANALFQGNSAKITGGAVYISDTGAKSIVHTGTLTFKDNVSEGSGGAISTGSNLTLGSNVIFDSNNSKDYHSGAISTLNGSTLTLSGNTLFKDNKSIYSLGGSAGAISTASLTLNANTGNIAFTGNTLDLEDSLSARSVYVYNRTTGGITITGDNNVYFDDPITVVGDTTAARTFTKSGTGFVQFVGDSTFGYGNAGSGSVAVNAGTFRLANVDESTTSSFRATGNGAFTLAGGATLAGQGTVQSSGGFTLSGKISPDGDRFEIPTGVGTLTVGAARNTVATDKKIGTLYLEGNTKLDGATLAVDLGTSNTSDNIAVTGNVTFGTNTNTVDLGSWQIGTFSILTASGTIADITDMFGAVTLDGGALGYRQKASLALDETSTALMLTTSVGNVALTWVGGGGNTWSTDTSSTAWKTASTTHDYFATGDIVTFNNDGVTNSTVTVASGGVTVGGMTIDGGSYIFTGADSTSKITGSTTASSDNVSATGALAVNSGAAIFQTGVDFVNGMSIANGAVVSLGNGGSFADSMTIVNDGDLGFAQTTGSYTQSGVISGSGDVTKTGDASLTLSGTHTSTGIFYHNLGDVTLNGSWAGSYQQLTNAGKVNTSAGASIGGNVTFTGLVELGGLLNIGNNLTLNGATVGFHLNSNSALTDRIVAAGNITFGATSNTVRLDNWMTGSFLLFESTGGTIDPITGKFTVINSGGMQLNDRQSAVLRQQNDQVFVDVSSSDNVNLVWTGTTGGTWNMLNTDWESTGPNVERVNQFAQGDAVTFNGGAPQTITLGGTATVSGMKILGGEYDFLEGSTGNKIVGTTNSATGTNVTPTGKLEITAGKTGLYIETDFVHGTEISGGSVVIGHQKAFGSFVDSATEQHGQVTIKSNADVTLTTEHVQTISNRFVVENNADLTMNTGTGLTVSGVHVSDTKNGAVFSIDQAQVDFNGGISFTNNSTGGNGGAIYANSSTLNFDTTKGWTVFSGNSDSSGNNAITLDGTNNRLNFTSQGTAKHGVLFDDTLRTTTESKGNRLNISFENSDSYIQFRGANTLNSLADSNNRVDVGSGTFRLAAGASFDAGQGASFNLASNSTLAGSGTLMADTFNIQGLVSADSATLNSSTTVVPESQMIGSLAFQGNVVLDGAMINVDLNTGNVSDTITVTGHLSFGANDSVVNLTTWADGYFTILTAGSIDSNTDKLVLRYLGATLSADLQLVGNSLHLTTSSEKPRDVIIWDGGESGDPEGFTWDEDAVPEGTYLVFNENSTETITVTPGTKILGGMENTGNRTLRPGRKDDNSVVLVIESDSQFDALVANGRLVLHDGTLTMQIAGDFENGVLIQNGTLGIGNDQAAGTYETGEETGQITVAGEGEINFDSTHEVQVRVIGLAGSKTTVSTKEGEAGVFANVTTDDSVNGGAVEVQSAEILFVGDIAIVNNTSGGDGGAIYLKNATVTFDPTGGGITVSGNVDSSGANSLALDGEGNQINFTGSEDSRHNVALDDPIRSLADSRGNQITVDFDNPENSAQFKGDNQLNERTNPFARSLFAAAAETPMETRSENLPGNHVNVLSGGLRIVENSLFDAGSDSTITVADRGRLAGGGSFIADAFEISGTISPDRAALRSTSSIIRSENQAASLTLNGNVKFDGAQIDVELKPNNQPHTSDTVEILGALSYGTETNTVNINAWNTGTFTVLKTANTGEIDPSEFELKFGGEDLGNRQGAQLTVFDDNQLRVETWMNASDRLRLTWTGSESNYLGTAASSNFVDDQGMTQQFNHSDYLVFDQTGRQGTVVLGGQNGNGGRTVSGMMVAGGTYSFEGGDLFGIQTAGDGTDGHLILADGNVEFKNNVFFEGNIEILNRSSVVLSNQKAFHAEGDFILADTAMLTMTVGDDLIRGSSVTLNGAVSLIGEPVPTSTKSPRFVDMITSTQTPLSAESLQGLFDHTVGLLNRRAIFTDGYSMDLQYTATPLDEYAATNGFNGNETEFARYFKETFLNWEMEDFELMLMKMDDAQLAATFELLSNAAIIAETQWMALSNPYRSVSQHLIDEEARAKESVYEEIRGQAKPASTRNFWFQTHHRSLEQEGDGNAKGYRISRTGMQLGLDTKILRSFQTGFVFGYGNPKLHTGGNRIEMDDYTFGLYAQKKFGANWNLNGFVGYGNQDYSSRRRTLDGLAQGSFKGDAMFANLELVRSFKIHKDYVLLPTLALDYQSARVGGFTEKNSAMRQTFQRGDLDQLVLRFGLNSRWRVSDRARLNIRLQYGRQLDGDRCATVRTALTQSSAPMMNMTGVNVGRDLFNVGIGGQFYLGQTRRTQLFGNYDFDRGNRSKAHTAELGFQFGW